MSDTQNQLPPITNKNYSGYYVARQGARLVKEAIEQGKAPFLPVNGNVSAVAVFNAKTGMPLSAKEMIPAILVRERNGWESNVVAYNKTAQEAQTSLKAKEKGIGHIFKGKDGENHIANFYFPEQMESPEKMREFAKNNIKWQQRLSGETFEIASSDVAEYLAVYVAACKSGAKIEVAPEVAEQFRANILAVADNELKPTAAEKNPNIPKMSDLLFSADMKSTEIIKAREKELGIGQSKAQEIKPKQNERSIDRSAAMSH